MNADRWVIATGNPGKVREIRAILAHAPIEVVGLEALPPVDFPAEGSDYAPNAAAKALTAAERTGLPAVADDSGLEVAGLGGAPGALSARYGGPGLDDRGRTAHLLEQMAGMDGAARAARFVCFAAWASPTGELVEAHGECAGSIEREARGQGGFGYDPVFRVADRDVTMAELEESEKNRISHRARAFLALVRAVSQRGEAGR